MTSAFANEAARPPLRRLVIGAWAAPLAVIGFVAGHSCLPNAWLHLGWLALAGSVAFACIDWAPFVRRWRSDAGALSVFAFLSWMTFRSGMSAGALYEIVGGILGVVLLVMFCALVWQQARDSESLHAMGRAMAWTSALAALISIALSYFLLPNHQAGERLMNLLVHGGLNPVCTGLIFGFAALWLAALVEHEFAPMPRRFTWAAVTLLHFAAFLSGSRGTMLALACGHAVLLLARGWRRGAATVCVFVMTGALYFTSAPLFASIAQWRSEPAAVVSSRGITDHFQKVVERGDNSRLDIYRAGWHAMDNLWIGTGQWGVRDLWQCELQAKTNISMMSHLHSAFFATFVHGGIIGAVLLLMSLAIAIRRACRLAIRGDATWIALLAFGCSGLLFDGESLASLTTAPRFEGLLFWLPLTVALARGPVTSPPADS